MGYRALGRRQRVRQVVRFFVLHVVCLVVRYQMRFTGAWVSRPCGGETLAIWECLTVVGLSANSGDGMSAIRAQPTWRVDFKNRDKTPRRVTDRSAPA